MKPERFSRTLRATGATLLIVLPLVASAQAPHGADHHPQASRTLMALHEIMEPLWHGTPGPELNAGACRDADEIGVRARAAALRPSPDHAALLGSARALKAACDAGDGVVVASELDSLHAIFHRLAGGRGG